MKLSLWITVNAILFIGLGIAFALYGPLMMAFFAVPGVPSDNNLQGNSLLYWNVASFARMFGAALFGFGFLLWSVRDTGERRSQPEEIRRGIIFSMLLANGMGVFVALTQQVAIWNSPAGWVTVGVFALLFLGYATFLVAP